VCLIFCSSIKVLDEPVDVHAEWIDQCDALNREVAPENPSKKRRVQEEDSGAEEEPEDARSDFSV
jgi:hypothetical protein